jgi:hypothetical protein
MFSELRKSLAPFDDGADDDHDEKPTSSEFLKVAASGAPPRAGQRGGFGTWDRGVKSQSQSPRAVLILVRKRTLPDIGATYFEAFMTSWQRKPWRFPEAPLHDLSPDSVHRGMCHAYTRARSALQEADAGSRSGAASARQASRLVHGGHPCMHFPCWDGAGVAAVFKLPDVVGALFDAGHGPGLHGAQDGPHLGQSLGQGAWVSESELARHATLGDPAAYGVPISPGSLDVWHQLPLDCQFASTSPPLVLYHGTSAEAVPGILALGLKPGADSAVAMLGPGVYLARWDKAVDFARHDADNKPRAVPGCVLRVVMQAAPDQVRVLGPADVCECGCGRSCVDHLGTFAKGGVKVVAVPDFASGASRRAEWCIKDPSCVQVVQVLRE